MSHIPSSTNPPLASALSVGDLSTISVAAPPDESSNLQLYTSPSGLNFVQISTNDDAMLMDLTRDFFVPPNSSIDDPIITDAEADALAAQQAAEAEALAAQQAAAAAEMNRAKLVRQQLEKAARRLQLGSPRSASGYKKFWDKAVQTLPKTVPILYNLILGNRSLADIVGYDEEEGWKQASSSFEDSNRWRRPSDATQLVTDCFNHIFHNHHERLRISMDNGIPLAELHSLSWPTEESALGKFSSS